LGLRRATRWARAVPNVRLDAQNDGRIF
jgi:hypothetical protein